MKLSFRAISLLPCLAALLAVGPAAHAATYSVSGSVWENGTTDNVPAAGSAIYSTPATATFTLANAISATDLINFNSGDDGTLSGFLLNGPSGLNGDSLAYLSGASHSGDSINNDLFEFNGMTTISAGTTYQFSHDDGLILYLNGVKVVDNGGPTSAELTNFVVCTIGSAGCTNNNNCSSSATNCVFGISGSSATDSFTLDYAEVAGPPAQLTANLALTGPAPNVTPEPSSLVLLGTGVIGAAGMLRRRFSM
ncbi:MAG TPA: PEP-CTERM sorting domain-containing protein [Acidobacteriaceae bacterium]|nr:PEP-CTERM sorting domain-containing protein [Acidobacteriaceae bacterium]